MGYLPETFHYKAGEIIWSRTDPKIKYKVLEVMRDYAVRGPKELLYVQNQNTKEIEIVLAEWMSKRDPLEHWTEDPKYQTSYRAIDELKKEKPKDLLSAEFEEGKKVSEIIASWNKVPRTKIALLNFLAASELSKKSGMVNEEIDEFLKNAVYRVAPDDMYWILIDSKRIACRIDDVTGELKNIKYYIHNSQVTPHEFLTISSKYDSTNISVTAFGKKFLLKFCGKSYLIGSEQLEEFCDDYGINLSSVKSSITKSGHWTYV
jgi:hypothetical protein